VRREAESAWNSEKAHLRRTMEHYRSKAGRASRELAVLKKVRATEKDELFALRAAVLEGNCEAKDEEARRIREAVRMEKELKSERVRAETVEKEKQEYVTLLQVTQEKLDEIDQQLESANRKMNTEVNQIVQRIYSERLNDLRDAISRADSTNGMIDKLSHVLGSKPRSSTSLGVEMRRVVK